MKLNRVIQKLNTNLHEKAEEDFKPILSAYKRALKEVEKEIGFIYAKKAVEGVIPKGSARDRLLILASLTKTIREQMIELSSHEESELMGILEAAVQESYLMTGFTLEGGLDVQLDFTLLNPTFVKSAVNMPIKGEMFSDRIWKNKELLLNRLRNELEVGIIKGESIDKMAKRIKDTFDISAYEAQRLMRTETARCITQAQTEVYKATGLVKKVLFDATLDNKTSEICQGFDGKYFDLGKEPHIPEDTHPNCRSCIIPVIEGWGPTRKRENKKSEAGEKPVIDYKNYEEWKETIKWTKN